MQRSTLDRHALAWAVVGLVGAFGLVGSETGLVLAAPILVVGTGDRPGLWTQVLWILGAGALGGALGYGVATLADPRATTIALGFGIAIGGGLGAVVRLLVIGETNPREPDDVTVSSSRTETSTPDPQPVDLFDENPDPVLYFDDSGDGPVVRAANRAFGETFGVESEAVENAALADALMVTDRADDIVTAAADAATFDAVIDCETPTDERAFRLRTVAVARGSGVRGYILYTTLTE